MTAFSVLTGGLRTRENKELLLMVFDEAASIWVGSGEQKYGAPCFALRRVLRMLECSPIWSLFPLNAI